MSSHTKYKIEYHVVWVTKYRYQGLKGDIVERTRELVRQACASFEIEIICGVLSKDYLHVLVSVPPTLKFRNNLDAGLPRERFRTW